MTSWDTMSWSSYGACGTTEICAGSRVPGKTHKEQPCNRGLPGTASRHHLRHSLQVTPQGRNGPVPPAAVFPYIVLKYAIGTIVEVIGHGNLHRALSLA